MRIGVPKEVKSDEYRVADAFGIECHDIDSFLA
jgi:alanine dehydrogenase